MPSFRPETDVAGWGGRVASADQVIDMGTGRRRRRRNHRRHWHPRQSHRPLHRDHLSPERTD